MGETERVYRIERLIRSRGVVPIRALIEELEVSVATVRRDIALLRDRLHAPIVYDRTRRGYRFDEALAKTQHELPGLWFSSREIHGLLTFYHFLESVEPGLLTPHIAPLKKRIQALLETKDDAFPEITRRVRILPQAARSIATSCFEHVAHALLARKRLRLRYHGRARDTQTERRVSPQRLAHYRDNWYLDAWDHGKRALRIFSLDRIQEPILLDEAAKEIPDARLDRHFAQSYGIFAGRPRRTAVLRFN
ncbi:MAG TPA: WYL domain-containing protein, partial [Burkholderiales bacterium]|nr:WYL domain-containing protein [Burkholderiales bacterium]